jgi:signal transduction histidine kinase/FixJ family two-component response regulator
MGVSRRGGVVAQLTQALNPWRAAARARAEAETAEGRLREALDALPTGVVLLDSERRYILWNKAYGEIYQRSSDLFRVGRRLADTLRTGVKRGDYPAAIGREEAWLAERLDQLENPNGERHEQQIRDGRWVMIEERGTADGGVIGLRVDITDLKAQATALREALTRAEAAGRAKAAFLANVSHELRTPLNGVIGLAEVLARGDLGAGLGPLVAEILANAGRLQRLLGDVLDFSALEAGQVEAVRLRFAPGVLVRGVVERFQRLAAAKGLALTVDIAASAEGQAAGDPDHLSQVLEQLLDNAVKFTQAGRVAVALTCEDGRWRLAVTDTGAGFDPADAERLFAGFELGDASPTREHGGAGLGLAICKRLAELMGGRIEAAGALGQGATFTLTLPLSPPNAAAASARALRVLVADDNATNRKVVELILQAVGAEVVSVENGAQAVAAAERESFDAILMDLRMPVMDGLAAIAGIRKSEAVGGRPRRPILVLSANDAPADIEASRRAGADGHLGKPIRPEVLLAALAQATGDRPPAETKGAAPVTQTSVSTSREG